MMSPRACLGHVGAHRCLWVAQSDEAVAGRAPCGAVAVRSEEFETSLLGSDNNNECFSDSSSTSSKGRVSGSSESGGKRAIRRPTDWLEMRGIKTNINKSSEKKGESPSRGKRKSEREDDEDYEEFSRKKQKVPGAFQVEDDTSEHVQPQTHAQGLVLH
ncbi:flotillin-1 [Platysternon megacephalum]|uniref:Flotillin-1 n=1 Tax=Platysternon megacephalum TaxID=55544 RepID=A0A4D9DT84_9SAUR|nr:flotillin-1 [Platysternon megacephalum]